MRKKIGELFAGIGGFGLGLEAALGHDWSIAWQVEKDEYARKVLAKHWPKAKRFHNVEQVGKQNLEHVSIVSAGWPCQGVSIAGNRKGLEDKRSGLWTEVARIVGDVRPDFVCLENSSNIVGIDNGQVLSRVFGDLAALGFDIVSDCIPAQSVGAPHRRDRWFCVAWKPFQRISNADRESLRIKRERERKQQSESGPTFSSANGRAANVADSDCVGFEPIPDEFAFAFDSNGVEETDRQWFGGLFRRAMQQPQILADGDERRFERERESQHDNQSGARGRKFDGRGFGRQRRRPTKNENEAFPGLGRIANGIPAGIYGHWIGDWERGIPRIIEHGPGRVDRLRCLGNSIVPAVAYRIGLVVRQLEEERKWSEMFLKS